MMKQKLFVFFLILICIKVSAQTEIKDTVAGVKGSPTIRICAPSRAGIIANPPVWVVNDRVIKNNLVMDCISPNSVESINVLKDKETVKIYGEQAVNGVVKIRLKGNAKLLDFEELLKKFKIKRKYWTLPAYVDNKGPIAYADFFITDDKVKNVEVKEKTIEQVAGTRFIKISIKP